MLYRNIFIISYYLFCKIISRKNGGYYFYFTANSIADEILDIAIHAYVLYFLISGIIYGYKLTKVKDDIIEGTATVEETALELDSEERDNIND